MQWRKPLVHICDDNIKSDSVIEAIKICPQYAFQKLGGCSQVLLHYACKSAKSTHKLFTTTAITSIGGKDGSYENKASTLTTNFSNYLLLPHASLDHIASHPQMVEAVNDQVTHAHGLVVAHFVGVCTIVLISCYVRLSYLMRVPELPTPRLAWLITLASLAAASLLSFEIIQIRAMRRRHPTTWLSTWSADFWNQVNMASVLWLPLTLVVGFRISATGDAFQVVVCVGGLLLMARLLGFVKIINIQLATFVRCLTLILSDILPFLVVMAIFMMGFGHGFFTLLSRESLSLHYDGPDNVRRQNAPSPIFPTSPHSLFPLCA